MTDIEIVNLTKDYGNKQGIFNINLEIQTGEVFGYVGTNGSGKTTTIRSAMGFIMPDKGSVKIRGLDAWKDACKIKKIVSYIPGEIAFPDLNSGMSFLKNQAEFQKVQDEDYIKKLLTRLKLDPTANLKRMSKGMKQKTAIIAGLMKDADIYIFDEPTTGLDPLMRQEFLNIIKEEKQKGKTIFISSQSFEELEQTCDRVALIIGGKIVDIANIKELKGGDFKNYKIEFNLKEDYESFKKLKYKIIRDQEKYNQVTINIKNKEITKLFKTLKKLNLKFISEVDYTLEKYFKEKLKIERKVLPLSIYKTKNKKNQGGQNV